MFDIFSWQHIIILLGVALIVVGPKDLPRHDKDDPKVINAEAKEKDKTTV
jgi:Sec-independent protein translocase protein TatA